MLERPGFYPAGGGRMTRRGRAGARAPAASSCSSAARSGAAGRAPCVADLPESIARRELAVVKEQLGWPDDALEVVEDRR